MKCQSLNLKFKKCSKSLELHLGFLFRDAKQYTGLMHCQSINLTKINNHLNISLISISIAKATHWDKNPKTPFSMADIKEYYHNLRMELSVIWRNPNFSDFIQFF